MVRGPISFVWLANARLNPAGRGDEQHAGAAKVLVLVKSGWQVTVSISGSTQSEVSLLYDPQAFGEHPGSGYSLDDGARTVVFTACSGHQQAWPAATQFNGGILASRSLCLRLSITGIGAGTYSKNLTTPLGRAATCPIP